MHPKPKKNTIEHAKVLVTSSKKPLGEESISMKLQRGNANITEGGLTSTCLIPIEELRRLGTVATYSPKNINQFDASFNQQHTFSYHN